MEAQFVGPLVNATARVQQLTHVFRGRQASPPAKPGSRFGAGEAGDGRKAGCLSDDDLVALVAEGSQVTLAELDDRYGQMAYGLALGIVGEPAIAEQVVEATIEAIWREGSTTATPLHAGAAMLARVHDTSVEMSLAPAGTEPGAFPREESRLGPSGGAWELEREPVHQALAQLPDEERELLVLAYYAGLSRFALTDGLEASAGTATTRIDVGLTRLAAALAIPGEENRNGASSRPSLVVAPPPARTGKAPAPPVILVCDAEPVHRELIRASLERGTCDVFEVDDYKELQPSIAALAPDLVILDPYVRNGDGIGELEALRVDPDLVRLPVLVLTAAVTRRRRDAALAAGANCFLPKPFSPRELASSVDMLLEASSTAAERSRLTFA
jgi:CheY-like chemotaxis protein/DNA-directed RNA polymerase specialized sigma24 family protein